MNIRSEYYNIIIINNCTIYKNKKILKAIWITEAQSEFLPLYCSQFNLIEQIFNILKIYLYKKYIKQIADYTDFKVFLTFTVNICNIESAAINQAQNHFKYTKYYTKKY